MKKDLKQTYAISVETNLYQLMLELSKLSIMHGWVVEYTLFSSFLEHLVPKSFHVLIYTFGCEFSLVL